MIDVREKGRAYERHVVNALRAIFGDAQVQRGYQYEAVSHPPDVVTPLISVECKVGKGWSPYAALEQAHRDCAPKTWPLVIARHDRRPSIAIIDLDLFLIVLGEMWDLLAACPSWRAESFWSAVSDHTKRLKEAASASATKGRGHRRGQTAKLRSPTSGPRPKRRARDRVDSEHAGKEANEPGGA